MIASNLLRKTVFIAVVYLNKAYSVYFSVWINTICLLYLGKLVLEKHDKEN